MTDTGDTEPTNVEIFNLVAAAIFASLYKSFPVPLILVPASLAEEVLGEDRYSEPAKPDGVHPPEYYEEQKPRTETTEGQRYRTIARYSIAWLQECGFMSHIENTVTSLGEHVLSPKGFEALAAIPTSLSTKDKQSLGTRVVAAAATVRDRATTAIISDIIGQIIGATSRSLMGMN